MASILVFGIFLMEQSIEYVRGALQSLIWTKEEKDEVDFEEEEETIVLRRPASKPWYRKSRKSIVRMIGSKMFSKPCERNRKGNFRNRSLVRMLASRLPLKPTKRAYFEMFAESRKTVMDKARTFVEDNLNTVKTQITEMGLADIGFLTSWDGFEESSSPDQTGIITRNRMEKSSFSLSHISDVSQEEIAAPPRCVKRGKMLRKKESSHNKISALEDELANLRAQIAMIVSIKDQPKASAIPAPPPPPPPPPSMVSATPPARKVPNLAVRKPLQRESRTTLAAIENGVPIMRDVLAGISSVKLKSSNITRSPGGTPMKSRNQISSSTDPADIIANALRKKFASARRSIGSPIADKENYASPHSGFSPSPKQSDYIDGFSPITSSPEKGRTFRRRSNNLTAKAIILSPVTEDFN